MRVLAGLLTLFSLKPHTASGVEIELKVGALNRYASIHMPIQQRLVYPTIIGLHGGGGNRDEFLEDAKIDQITKLRGFIFVGAEGIGPVFPSGKVAGSWNAGRCCGPAMEEKIDDIAYLKALIQTLVAKHRADPKRIYLLGFSNGGKMAYRAACEMADQIAGIATMGAIGVYDSKAGAHDNCPLVRPVPTFHLHGLNDKCSPAQGGDAGNCFNEFIAKLTDKEVEDADKVHVSLEPSKPFIEHWAKRMGFTHSRPGGILPGESSLSYGKSLLAPRMVVSWHLDGVGHVVPGGDYGAVCALGAYSKPCMAWKSVVKGPKDTERVPYPLFNAARHIIDFFERLP